MRSKMIARPQPRPQLQNPGYTLQLTTTHADNHYVVASVDWRRHFLIVQSVFSCYLFLFEHNGDHTRPETRVSDFAGRESREGIFSSPYVGLSWRRVPDALVGLPAKTLARSGILVGGGPVRTTGIKFTASSMNPCYLPARGHRVWLSESTLFYAP